MTKVRIRRAVSQTKWQLVTFCGKRGAESRGVVDMIAVRKDHGTPQLKGTKRGDALQIMLIQVKGGKAAMPTTEDGRRLTAVAEQLNVKDILLASWTKGSAAKFYSHQPEAVHRKQEWLEFPDLDKLFK